MEVRIVHPSETRTLRHQVLWPHIQRMEDCTIDMDGREDAFHLATCEGEEIISVGSFFEMKSPKISKERQYRLRAMATDPRFRGMRAGEMLIREAIDMLRQNGIEVLWCDARIGAVDFYIKIGFTLIDEIYEVPIIGPHKFMYVLL